jgi:predicted transcriptional regulator
MAFGDKVPVQGTHSWGGNVAYYRSGNIGWWLKLQRQSAKMTRTQVADAMGWPRGAIKDIEEGRRIPKARTVEKYLSTLRGYPSYRRNMYARFHRNAS